MSNLTLEQKLQLISSMKENHHHNHDTMRNREAMLSNATMPLEPQPVSGIGFRLRFLLALILFLFFIVMDFNHFTVAGIGSNDIHSYITKDFQPNIFDFIDTFPYTDY